MLDNNINEININNSNNNIIIINDNGVISSSNSSYAKKIQDMINDDNYNIVNIDGHFMYKDKYNSNIFNNENDTYYSKNVAGLFSFNENDINTNVLIKSRFNTINNEYFTNALLESYYDANGKLIDDIENIDIKNVALNKINRVKKSLSILEFSSCLKNASKKGTFREYEELEHNDTKVRGRIDVSRQIIENQSIQGKVCYTTKEYTPVNPINKLILKTYLFLEKNNNDLLKRNVNINKDSVKFITQLKNTIPNIDEYGNDSILKQSNFKITNMVYKEYELLRKTCIGIIKSKGEYTFDVNDSRLSGVVMDLDRLWSLYVYKNIVQKINDELKNDDEKKNEEINLLNNKDVTKHDFIFNINNSKVLFDTSYSKLFEDYDQNEELKKNQKIKYDQIINNLISEAKENDINSLYLIYPMLKTEEVDDYKTRVKKLPIDDKLTLYKMPYFIDQNIENYDEYKNYNLKMNKEIIKFIKSLK